MTDVENPKAVLVWEKIANEKVYALRLKQAREYMIQLSGVFYEHGCGILLEKKVKELCYEYRNLLYGVLLTTKNAQGADTTIRLKNQELVSRMKDVYNELNTELRKELEKIEK